MAPGFPPPLGQVGESTAGAGQNKTTAGCIPYSRKVLQFKLAVRHRDHSNAMSSGRPPQQCALVTAGPPVGHGPQSPVAPAPSTTGWPVTLARGAILSHSIRPAVGTPAPNSPTAWPGDRQGQGDVAADVEETQARSPFEIDSAAYPLTRLFPAKRPGRHRHPPSPSSGPHALRVETQSQRGGCMTDRDQAPHRSCCSPPKRAP